MPKGIDRMKNKLGSQKNIVQEMKEEENLNRKNLEHVCLNKPELIMAGKWKSSSDRVSCPAKAREPRVS